MPDHGLNVGFSKQSKASSRLSNSNRDRRAYKNISIYITKLPPTPKVFRDKYHRTREPEKGQIGRGLQYTIEDFTRGRPQTTQLAYIPHYLVPKRPCTIGFVDSLGSASDKSAPKKDTSKSDYPADDAITQQWLADIDEYDMALDELASATQDKEYVEEITIIKEEWCQLLSDAEKTATIYTLAQHTTERQIRFLLTVLQHMAKSGSMPPDRISLDKGMSTSHYNGPTPH